MIRFLCCIFFCTLFFASTAQRKIYLSNRYAKGLIVFNNDKTLECEIAFPIPNRSKVIKGTLKSKSKLHVKDLKGKKRKLDIDDIYYIELEGPDGLQVLEMNRHFSYRLNGKRKQSNYLSWHLLELDCKEAQTYIWADRYDIDKEGRIVSHSINLNGKFSIRTGEEKWPTVISPLNEYISKENYLISPRFKCLKKYFKSDKLGTEFLKGKESVTYNELLQHLRTRCED